MYLLSARFLFAILAIPLSATAETNQCNGISEIQQYAPGTCECGKSLSRLPIKAPKGMSLIAACRYQKVEFVGTVGDFFFKGNATVSGIIKRVSNPTLGDNVTFNAKTTRKHGEFADALASLRFGNDLGTIQRFRLPPLSEKSPCWAANAAIKVSRLQVHAGYESDNDGNFPIGFEVVKVGPYTPCQTEKDEIEDEEE